MLFIIVYFIEGSVMQTKKKYVKPFIKTEKLEIGVFGCYGNNGGGVTPIKIWNPFFAFCCS